MRICLMIAILALCGGCGVKKPGNYGNFAEVESAALVQDAMTVMLANYPPAKTSLHLLQAADDAFGSVLAETLRANGYAVAEYAVPDKGGKYRVFAEKPDGLAFAYVLDRIGQEGELRLTLHVGSEAISRLYLIQGEGAEARHVPAGLWVRRQQGESHG